MTKIITFQPFREAKDDAGTAAGDQCDEAEVIDHCPELEIFSSDLI